MGWTQERRQKHAEMIHKWKPWEKSTGPKTAEGKAISSKNSYKHGLSKLQKEMRELLKQHERAIEVIR